MSKIITVIHTINLEQVQYNVNLCHNNGVNDVFLISHMIRDWKRASFEFEKYFNWIKETYPLMNVGINYLQLPTLDAINEANRIGFDYLWADKSYIHKNTLHEALLIKESKPNIKYFGCVAFKYQKPEEDLEWTCKTATSYMDVVTTSGEATANAPSIEKIRTMKEYIGDMPLAIASGITPENKSSYEQWVDYFLVASSITGDGEIIIEKRLKDLLK